MTDDEFLAAFEACTLPKAEWKHAAHIRMAWLYLGRLPFDAALERIRGGIQRYNAAKGTDPTLYHETVTVAFTHLIHDRRQAAAKGEDFPAFAARCPELIRSGLHTLLQHYTRETLDSPAARERFVEPDRAPLPKTNVD